MAAFIPVFAEPQVLISFGTLPSNGLLVSSANSVYGFIQAAWAVKITMCVLLWDKTDKTIWIR